MRNRLFVFASLALASCIATQLSLAQQAPTAGTPDPGQRPLVKVAPPIPQTPEIVRARAEAKARFDKLVAGLASIPGNAPFVTLLDSAHSTYTTITTDPNQPLIFAAACDAQCTTIEIVVATGSLIPIEFSRKNSGPGEATLVIEPGHPAKLITYARPVACSAPRCAVASGTYLGATKPKE